MNKTEQRSNIREILDHGLAGGTLTRENRDWALAQWEGGFDLMADLSLIKGKERIDNYSSALEDREQITLALKRRVLKGQTSKVGPWRGIESLPHDSRQRSDRTPGVDP